MSNLRKLPPTKVKIDDEYYDINYDYITAIECDEISRDESIGDYETKLAIIYKLFGDKGLEDKKNHDKLLDFAIRFLTCDIAIEENATHKKPDMDYIQDMDLIKTSFYSDYKINLDECPNMHWWDFYRLLSGLSNSEYGNCCIFNQVRNLRNIDTTKIKDLKMRKEIEDAQKRFSLNEQPKNMSQEKIDNINEFINLIT